MKQKRFRFLTLILSFSLLATIMLTNSAFALSNDSPISSQEVVYKTVSAMDSHDWDTYVALQCNENKADFEGFLGRKDNKAQQIGLFNIISAKVYEIKELPLKKLRRLPRLMNILKNMKRFLHTMLVSTIRSTRNLNTILMASIIILLLSARKRGNGRSLRCPMPLLRVSFPWGSDLAAKKKLRLWKSLKLVFPA